MDARAHLSTLVGKSIHAIGQSRPNRIVTLDGADVVVATTQLQGLRRLPPWLADGPLRETEIPSQTRTVQNKLMDTLGNGPFRVAWKVLITMPSRDGQAAGPLQARPTVQACDRPRRRPSDHVPRAAPHVRDSHGGPRARRCAPFSTGWATRTRRRRRSTRATSRATRRPTPSIAHSRDAGLRAPGQGSGSARYGSIQSRYEPMKSRAVSRTRIAARCTSPAGVWT
jgi:hypothetical protein